jgi:hypothetical protein
MRVLVARVYTRSGTYESLRLWITSQFGQAASRILALKGQLDLRDPALRGDFDRDRFIRRGAMAPTLHWTSLAPVDLVGL